MMIAGIPPEASDGAKNNKIALLDSINNSLSDTRRALDLNFSTSSQGGFVLEKSDFVVLDKIPPIDSALVWDGKRYSGSVSLGFEVIDVNQDALNQKGNALEEIKVTLDRWNRKYQFYLGREGEMDSDLASLGQDQAFYMFENIEELKVQQLVVASVSINGKKNVLAITSIMKNTKLEFDDDDPEFDVSFVEDRGSAYLDNIIAYPESQLYRNKRSVGQIGSVARPVRDFALRELRKSGKFSAIYGYSANNKSSTALKEYGFKPVSKENTSPCQ